MNAICQTYDSLLAKLEEIGDGSDHMKAVEAKGLYYQIASEFFPAQNVFLISCRVHRWI